MLEISLLFAASGTAEKQRNVTSQSFKSPIFRPNAFSSSVRITGLGLGLGGLGMGAGFLWTAGLPGKQALTISHPHRFGGIAYSFLSFFADWPLAIWRRFSSVTIANRVKRAISS
jgi:hypothetical protein